MPSSRSSRGALAAILPLLVLVFFAATQKPIEYFNSQASRDAFHAGIGSGVARDWIDRAVGRDADVAAIYTGQRPFVATWDNEVFNRSLHTIYNFGLFFDGLPQTQIAPDPETGIVHDAAGNKPHPEYVLADDTVLVRGKVVRHDDPVGLTLYKSGPQLALRGQSSGIYPDGWSGPTAAFTIYGCEGGTLSAHAAWRPGARRRTPQTVTASPGSRRLARTTVPAQAGKPASGSRSRPRSTSATCSLAVTPDRRPRADDRDARHAELGIRMLNPVYSPS